MTIAAQIGQTTTAIFERAKRLLLDPKAEWPTVEAEPATIGAIYSRYVAILAALPALSVFIGTLVFGIPILGVAYRPPFVNSVTSALWSYFLQLGGVFALALIIEALAPTFGGQANRVGAFKVAAYSATAAWLAGVFQIVPWLGFLSILGFYSLYLLYTGLPVLMKVPQEKALLFVLTLVLIAAVLAIAFVAVATQRSTGDCAALDQDRTAILVS